MEERPTTRSALKSVAKFFACLVFVYFAGFGVIALDEFCFNRVILTAMPDFVIDAIIVLYVPLHDILVDLGVIG